LHLLAASQETKLGVPKSLLRVFREFWLVTLTLQDCVIFPSTSSRPELILGIE